LLVVAEEEAEILVVLVVLVAQVAVVLVDLMWRALLRLQLLVEVAVLAVIPLMVVEHLVVVVLSWFVIK